MSSRRGIPCLPEDVIIYALLRLPVIALLRFKSVCKAWNNIICSSRFANEHYNRPSNPTYLVVHESGEYFDSYQHKPINFTNPFPYLVHSISLFPDETLENPVDLDSGFFRRTHVSYVCGPCNGIFCVHLGNGSLALWNPATRKTWQLACDSPDLTYVSSFWVDPVTNDFKIFLVQDLGDHHGLRFVRYASCNDSWRYFRREEFNPKNSWVMPSCSYSVFKGFYYFLTDTEFLTNTTEDPILIAFDIFEEVFHEIEMPMIDDSKLVITLDFYDDSLAVFYTDRRSNYADVEDECIKIWLMKENGCWTKLFNVVLDLNLEPLRFWNRNELLISSTHNRELMKFDIVSGKTRRLESRTTFDELDIDNVSMQRVPLSYKESLTSIKI